MYLNVDIKQFLLIYSMTTNETQIFQIKNKEPINYESNRNR
jgi:hypothetical protein